MSPLWWPRWSMNAAVMQTSLWDDFRLKCGEKSSRTWSTLFLLCTISGFVLLCRKQGCWFFKKRIMIQIMPLRDSCLRAGTGEDGFTNRLTNTRGKDGQNVDKCHGSEDGLIIAVVYSYVPQIKTASHWKIVNAHTPFIFNNSLNVIWKEAEKLQLSLPQNHNCSVQSNKSLCGLNTVVEIYYVTASWFVLESMDFSKISKLHTDSASKRQKTAFYLSKKINWSDWSKSFLSKDSCLLKKK